MRRGFAPTRALAPIEHIELATRMEPAERSLDFELPLETLPATEASAPCAASECVLQPGAEPEKT